jgi:hypothetical protein
LSHIADTIKKNKKINDIYRELKDNKLEKETRYSIGVLLRVFIELSCEEYYFRRKPIPWDGSSLEKKFQSVLKDLEPNCDKDKRAKFHSIYNETFDQKNGSIIKLHKLIHERNYMIDENHLKSIWDTMSPDLTVSSPADGATIYGDKNKQITIDAKTEGGISVQINGRNAQVADDGSVKGSMTLAEGENTIEIKAVDKAGNEKVVSLLVTFKP